MTSTVANDSATATPPSLWTRRQRLAAGAFVAYLVVQVTVPVVLLFEPRPAPLGWQMYSGVRMWPEYSLVVNDTLADVHVDRFLVRRRNDFVAPDLSHHICARITGATAVIERRGEADVREVRCR